MRRSNLFTKTLKEIPKDETALNARLLIRGGFIDKTMAGVYSYLPLGNRVLTKIEDIVREEMDRIGQEVLLPALAPQDLWQATGRLESVNVLFEARGANESSRQKNSSEYVLNSTHEEIVTPLVMKHAMSYKDLPVAVYQIQTKFRNEPRSKSGLLRGREFRMKDLYSFHKSEADLLEYYEKSKSAYMKVFERLGLGADTYITLASGGDFTKDYSHEFQTVCDNGEDLVFRDPGSGVCWNKEVAPSQSPASGDKDEEMGELREVETKGVTTVEKLAEFMGVSADRTTKTMLYETENGIVAAAVRGDYDVNEEKLVKVLGCKKLELAGQDTIRKVSGAEIGYAGLLGLPAEVKIVVDESLQGVKNLEMGANKTDYHMVNVNWGRDLEEPAEFADIKVAKPGDISPESGKEYEVMRASEVGNIFPLNIKFSQAFNYYYTDENGDKNLVYMGSYGIGPSRLMGVLVEKFHDDKGIIWPDAVAPYYVHLISLKENSKAEELYKKLDSEGLEVLFDDREEVAAGEKFSEADLIGCPYRVVVSAKTLEYDSVEVKRRDREEAVLIKIEEVIEYLKNNKKAGN